jgi:predicted anti-sigma-YlaC factor YlaD
MEPTCRFGLEYTPAKGQDKVLELHLQNCEDCQGQFEVLG